MKEQVAAVLELVSQAEAFRPVVQEAIKAVKSYGPEIYDFAEGITLGSCELRAKAVRKYEELGFTRQEAILLTIDQSVAMREAIRSSQANSKQKAR